jgi:LEA14-like dessication related protein
MNVMKKLLPLLLVCAFTNCQSLRDLVQEPKVSLNRVDIARISLSGVDLVVRLDVENPNAISIPLPKIDWELFINTASFVRGSVKENQTIRGREKTTLDIPVSVTYDGLYNSIRSLVDLKEAAYEIALDVSFPLPIIADKVYHLDFAGVIPLLRRPDISFQGITRRSGGLGSMEFTLNWEVDNSNSFGFDIREFNYNFSVNNSQWAQGRIDNPPKIRANGKTVIPLTISISALSIVTELAGIISRGSPVTYSCTGNMSLSGELPGLDRLELPLNLQGNTQIR